MIYYRCKCGRYESWSSMGTADCKLCPDCNTTLACNSEGHKEIAEPHDWHETDEKTTYRGEISHMHFRKCMKCGEREDLKGL